MIAAHSITAAEIAAATGGIVVGDDRVLAPGPGHSPRDRSLSIRIAPDAPDGFIVESFAGDDWRGCKDYVKKRLGLPGWPAAERVLSQVGTKPRPEKLTQVASVSYGTPDPAALALWRSSAVATDDSLVRLYLSQHRAFTGPIPASIRNALGADYRPAGIRLPAMVAAVQRSDRRIIAVQATYLRAADGAKAPVSVPRMTVGALGDGAVRLGPAGPTLGLAEGVETGLSAMAMSGVAVWCSLGAARLHRVRVPDDVREIVIFADADEPGQRAADRAAETHTKAGRRVTIRTPIDQSDWNDVAVALAREVTA